MARTVLVPPKENPAVEPIALLSDNWTLIPKILYLPLKLGASALKIPSCANKAAI